MAVEVREDDSWDMGHAVDGTPLKIPFSGFEEGFLIGWI
jgi:hypothetical protein